MGETIGALTRWENYLRRYGGILLNELAASELKRSSHREVELNLIGSYLVELALHERQYGALGISKDMLDGLELQEMLLQERLAPDLAHDVTVLLCVARPIVRAAVPVISHEMHRDLSLVLHAQAGPGDGEWVRGLPTYHALSTQGLIMMRDADVRLGGRASTALQTRLVRNALDNISTQSEEEAATIFATECTPE